MAWLVPLLVVPTCGVVRVPLRRRRALRRAREQAEVRAFRLSRRAAHEDVTALADQLADLTGAPVAEDADAEARDDLRRAARAHAEARDLLHAAQAAEDVAAATRALAAGRCALAVRWARLAGEEPPAARPPCFFNPRHGPATADLTWSPPGCTAHDVPVCRACRERSEAGLMPRVRDVLLGNRHVPWFQGGPDYGPYAEGYYGEAARHGRFPVFVVGALLRAPGPGPAAPDVLEEWHGWAGEHRTDEVPEATMSRFGRVVTVSQHADDVEGLDQIWSSPDSRGRRGLDRPG